MRRPTHTLPQFLVLCLSPSCARPDRDDRTHILCCSRAIRPEQEPCITQAAHYAHGLARPRRSRRAPDGVFLFQTGSARSRELRVDRAATLR